MSLCVNPITIYRHLKQLSTVQTRGLHVLCVDVLDAEHPLIDKHNAYLNCILFYLIINWDIYPITTPHSTHYLFNNLSQT